MNDQGLIDSIEELTSIALSRPKLTRSYRVTEEVAVANYSKMREQGLEKLQPMTESEMQELGDYVGIDVSEIRNAHPCVEPTDCPACGRRLTFLDLIHEAASSGQHDKRFMGEVLLGKHGYVITINGVEDNTHVMRCVRCGDRTVNVQHGPCYHSGGCVEFSASNASTPQGGYAHCAW